MRAALITDGIVTNIIEVDDGFELPAVVTGDLPVQIGDSYDGADFYRNGEKLTEQTGLQAESDAISAEYAAAMSTTEEANGETD